MRHFIYFTPMVKEASSSVIHFNMKEGKTSGSFSWIYESLKSTVTLRLIFGARSSRLLLRPLEIVHSRLPFLFPVFICTRGIIVTVKIKSLVVSPEILFPTRTCILAAVCFVQHPFYRYSRTDTANAPRINPNSNKLFIS